MPLWMVLADSKSFVTGKPGMNMFTGALNELCMYRDINVDYDAWEIGRMYEAVPVKLKGRENFIFAVSRMGFIWISIGRKHIYLAAENYFSGRKPQIEFKTKVDWRERHKLLKWYFDNGIHKRSDGGNTVWLPKTPNSPLKAV